MLLFSDYSHRRTLEEPIKIEESGFVRDNEYEYSDTLKILSSGLLLDQEEERDIYLRIFSRVAEIRKTEFVILYNQQFTDNYHSPIEASKRLPFYDNNTHECFVLCDKFFSNPKNKKFVNLYGYLRDKNIDKELYNYLLMSAFSSTEKHNFYYFLINAPLYWLLRNLYISMIPTCSEDFALTIGPKNDWKMENLQNYLNKNQIKKISSIYFDMKMAFGGLGGLVKGFPVEYSFKAKTWKKLNDFSGNLHRYPKPWYQLRQYSDGSLSWHKYYDAETAKKQNKKYQ